MPRLWLLMVVIVSLPGFSQVRAADSLPSRIDALIEARARGKPMSPPADDAEFLRRVYLDLAGTIPDIETAKKFLADRTADRRSRLIDDLLGRPSYAERMATVFHVHLMERLGDHPDWIKYLREAFAANRPWDEMARDMLQGRPPERWGGAAFFLSKRLENYGQNPVDYPGLVRDIGRMFLGRDLRCAQCHDHLFVKEYKQADFQGLFQFVQNAYLADGAKLLVGEKPLEQKVSFISVFGKTRQETGPRVPGRKELSLPKLNKTELYVQPPEPRKKVPGVLRFSPLAELSREVPQSPDFARNIVNRVWWLMLGRGLVHPLDLHHAENPPSHPELLDLLAREFIAHKYDLRWLIGEIARTQAYQRSSELPEGVSKLQPELFLTAIEKRMSAEQLLASMLEATGMREEVTTASKSGGKTTPLEQARQRFVKAFAGQSREPEEEFVPSLKGALYLLNDPSFLGWFEPRPGNLIGRLDKMTNEEAIVTELYLAILTRQPTSEERTEMQAVLRGKSGKARQQVMTRLAWALITSTEFTINH